MLIRRFLCGAVGGVVPSVVPAIVVTGLDAGRGGQDFAELRTAIFCGSESALGLVPELNVVWEQRLLVHRRRGQWRSPGWRVLRARTAGSHGRERDPKCQKCPAIHRRSSQTGYDRWWSLDSNVRKELRRNGMRMLETDRHVSA